MHSLVAWFTRNHVAANLLMVAILFCGILSWSKIKKEVFPEIFVDTISVRYIYPGASPEDVENSICKRVETKINDLDGIKDITTLASEGVASVFIELKNGTDEDALISDIKTRIDSIDDLPAEVEKPIVEKFLIRKQVLSIAISADMDEKDLRVLAEEIRDDLLVYESKAYTGKNPLKSLSASNTKEVTQATLAGTRPYEISIEVPEKKLEEYNLNFSLIANAIKKSSIDLPSGEIKTPSGNVLLRTDKQKYTTSEFKKIPIIVAPDGTNVKLGSIAKITDGFEDIDIKTYFNGKPALLIQVYRTGDEDTLAISRISKEFIKSISHRLPEGVELTAWGDDSLVLKGRMDLLGKNAFYGFLLVLITLTLFLRLSLAFFVCIGIPVAFLGGIWSMSLTDVSINVVSLFAFILVLGIVVDDAIVVGENVFTHNLKGDDPKKSALLGAQEVSVIVTFGIITTIIAFFPMLTIGGVMGKIFKNIPLVVIPTLIFSLIESKLILPAHLASLPKSLFDKKESKNKIIRKWARFQNFFANGLESFVEKFYKPFLKLCLNFRYLVLIIFICLFVISISLIRTGHLKFRFFPAVDADNIIVHVELARGSSIKATENAMLIIEKASKEIANKFSVTDKNGNRKSAIQNTMVSIGTQPFQSGPAMVIGIPTGSHLGEINVELLPSEERDNISAETITNEWRKIVKNIPGVEKISFTYSVTGSSEPINIQITGKKIAVLRKVSEEIKQELSTFTGVFDISDSFRLGKKEAKPILKPSAVNAGVSELELASQLRQGFYGEEIQNFQRNGNEVKVMLRYPKEERKTIFDLNKLKVKTQNGSQIPFTSVADINVDRGYSSITRVNGRRAINVTADVNPSIANASEILTNLNNEILPAIMQKYPSVNYSFEGEEKENADSLVDMRRGGLIALLLIYAALAIPLKSYWQPLIIMSAIPFGFVGAIAGHKLLGYAFSIMSVCGLVALMGVVVNDSLVLVDFINRKVKEKKHSIVEAANIAGARRFRPIILTSLTTFAGLSPMLLEKSMQAKFLIPMAISLGFGILFATLITLILVPCMYIIQNDIANLFTRKPKTESFEKPQEA